MIVRPIVRPWAYVKFLASLGDHLELKKKQKNNLTQQPIYDTTDVKAQC